MKKLNKAPVLILLFVFAFAVAASAQTSKKVIKINTQTAKVLIGENGYEPRSLNLKRGIPARITFLRTTDRTCGTEIVIPTYGVNRPLPLNEVIIVNFTPKKTGEFGFSCGMNMMHGKMVVQ